MLEMGDMGKTIRRLRLAKGWTQGQLADRVGVALDTICRYENHCWDKIQVWLVFRLCVELETTPDELFGITKPVHHAHGHHSTTRR